jgi:hypothetical protein
MHMPEMVMAPAQWQPAKFVVAMIAEQAEFDMSGMPREDGEIDTAGADMNARLLMGHAWGTFLENFPQNNRDFIRSCSHAPDFDKSRTKDGKDGAYSRNRLDRTCSSLKYWV